MFYEIYKESSDTRKYIREHLDLIGYKKFSIIHATVLEIDLLYKNPNLSIIAKKLIEEIRESRRINNCMRTARRRQLGKNTRRKVVKPEWADEEKIKQIYAKAKAFRDLGIDVHVDHIIPLHAKKNGDHVACGLHVHSNLRIRRAKDNMSKGCKLPEDV